MPKNYWKNWKKQPFPRLLCITVLVYCQIGLVYARNYQVGPSKPYARIGQVPWDSLHPGDSVLIHYRTEPYKEKWVICTKGTKNAPIVISGVPNGQGAMPIIDGNGAVTDSKFNYWNENRGLVKIGGANKPKDTMPEYIILQNLDIKSARPGYTFTGRDGVTDYIKNAAAVYIEKGEHIVIRNCRLRDCGNGLFAASKTKDLLVEHCSIYDNGIENSIYEHNNYTEAQGIVFQFNHFGPLRKDCPGNNLKDRSKGCVIRYNWIEAGNRQLDLVHSEKLEFYTDTTYNKTFVYGNILIEPEGAGNSQVCHYGGDDNNATHSYRKGMLYFYHNTVISTRSSNTTLVRLSTDDEHADIRNNIVYVGASGSRLAILNDKGRCELGYNWFKEGWRKSHSNSNAQVYDMSGNQIGSAPGFIEAAKHNYGLVATSQCRSGGTLIAPACIKHQVLFEYVHPIKRQDRPQDAIPDIGAYEYRPTAIRNQSFNFKRPFSLYTLVGPNKKNSGVRIVLNSKISINEVDIFDVQGVLVRSIVPQRVLENEYWVRWNGTLNSKYPLGNGMFILVFKDDKNRAFFHRVLPFMF